ncbi:hypothetical protein pEaSNUABM54_00002 [Erwinia phage pEa_SNUABM_54]|nr:hypothetical protein pEaSNUABM54_00002 [Erwinia phage pEa_SNUABM_54]
MQYKSLLNISAESLVQETVLPEGRVPLAPTDVAYNEDGSVVLRTDEDLAVSQEAIASLATIYHKLTNIKFSMRANAAYGPLSKVSVEAYDSAINHVLRNTGLRDLMVSVEGFEYDHDSSLTYSEEGIKDALQKIIDKIVELIKGWFTKAENYAEKILAGTADLKPRAQALRDAIRGWGPKEPKVAEIDISGGEAAWITYKGTPNLLYASGIAAGTCQKTIAGLPSDCVMYVNKLTDVLRGWTRDPNSYNPDNPFEDNKFFPRLPETNPKTMVSEQWSIGPYQLGYTEHNHLKTASFTEREGFEMGDGTTLKVLTPGELSNVVASFVTIFGITENINDIGKKATDALKSFGKSIEDLANIEADDDSKVDDMRASAMEAWESVRSFSQLPLAVEGKVLQVARAAIAVAERMVEAYGEKPAESTEENASGEDSKPSV